MKWSSKIVNYLAFLLCLAKLSEMEDRLHQQQLEFAQKERKDRLLVMRLATKEQELQELAVSWVSCWNLETNSMCNSSPW